MSDVTKALIKAFARWIPGLGDPPEWRSDHDVFFDADGNVVAEDDPNASFAYFVKGGYYERVGVRRKIRRDRV